MDTQIVPTLQNFHNERKLCDDVESKLSSGSCIAIKQSPSVELEISDEVDPKSIPNGTTKKGKRNPQTLRIMERVRRSKIGRKRALLNVGGEKHEISWELLGAFPDTRLGRLKSCTTFEEIMQLCDDYSITDNEYFFDQPSRAFSSILNLYRKGYVHLVDDLCIKDYTEDMQYWGLDETYLDSCCQLKYQQRTDQMTEDIKKDAEFSVYSEVHDFESGYCLEFRKYIWFLFEDSITGPQKIVGLISILFILVSVMTLSLSTVPAFQRPVCRYDNGTEIECDPEVLSLSSPDTEDGWSVTMEEDIVLTRLEEICIAWFTFEYIARLLTTPNLVRFLKSWLNLFDLLAIIPFYLSIFLPKGEDHGRVLKILRIVRVLRICKLARHSTGLQSLGYTLRKSYKDLGVLLLFLAVSVIIFSAPVYFAEKDENEKFGSMPETFYWALITMTTVGFGDIYPETPVGKVIAMIAGVCGVVLIALPIPIVVNNFGLFYDEHKKREKAQKRRQKILDKRKAAEKSGEEL